MCCLPVGTVEEDTGFGSECWFISGECGETLVVISSQLKHIQHLVIIHSAYKQMSDGSAEDREASFHTNCTVLAVHCQISGRETDCTQSDT